MTVHILAELHLRTLKSGPRAAGGSSVYRPVLSPAESWPENLNRNLKMRWQLDRRVDWTGETSAALLAACGHSSGIGGQLRPNHCEQEGM